MPKLAFSSNADLSMSYTEPGIGKHGWPTPMALGLENPALMWSN